MVLISRPGTAHPGFMQASQVLGSPPSGIWNRAKDRSLGPVRNGVWELSTRWGRLVQGAPSLSSQGVCLTRISKVHISHHGKDYPWVCLHCSSPSVSWETELRGRKEERCPLLWGIRMKTDVCEQQPLEQKQKGVQQGWLILPQNENGL